jgi:hypothetical protein
MTRRLLLNNNVISGDKEVNINQIIGEILKNYSDTIQVYYHDKSWDSYYNLYELNIKKTQGSTIANAIKDALIDAGMICTISAKGESLPTETLSSLKPDTNGEFFGYIANNTLGSYGYLYFYDEINETEINNYRNM